MHAVSAWADARRRLEAIDGVARSDLHLELDDGAELRRTWTS